MRSDCEQGGQPERRFARFLNSTLFGRRPVTLVVMPECWRIALSHLPMNNIFTSLRYVFAAVRHREGGVYDQNAGTKDIPIAFNVYGKDQEASPQLDDEVFVGAPAQVVDNLPDEEYDYALLPQIVKDRGWWLIYSGELIEAVLLNALTQKPNATDAELLEAVEYYSKHDTFLHRN